MGDLHFSKSVNEIYQYIEDHLCDDIQISSLAEIAGYSLYHFQRLFKQQLGMTVHQFIRHVRLVAAAKQMVSGDLAITDIAFSCGYDTLQSFSREFKKTFHLSPSNFRKQGNLQLISFREQYLRIKPVGDAKLLPRIETWPERIYYYVCKIGGTQTDSIPAAQAGFAEMRRWVEEHGLGKYVAAWLGQMPDEPDITLPDEKRYHAGVMLNAGMVLPDAAAKQVECTLIPAGKWAVFRVTGPYEHLWQTWSAVYRDWLPVSGYQLAKRTPHEIYLNSPFDSAPDELLTEIYLPIQS